MLDELLELVQLTSAYLQQDVEKPTSRKPVAIKTAPTLPPAEKKTAITVEPPTKREEPSPLSAMHSLFAKIAPKMELKEPTSPILLVMRAESERPFLEKVCQAISSTVAPAKLISVHDHIWNQPGVEVVIAPMEVVKKGEIHKLMTKQRPYVLPIANVADYERHVPLKRELWLAIKRIPTQLASS